MMPSLFQSVSILVAFLAYASTDPFPIPSTYTYVILMHNHGDLTLPPGLTHRPYHTSKPMPKTVDTPNTSSEDKKSPKKAPTVTSNNNENPAKMEASDSSQSIPSGESASAIPSGQKSPSKLAAPSKRVKKTSVTGVPSNREEKSPTRPRAMTLPR